MNKIWLLIMMGVFSLNISFAGTNPYVVDLFLGDVEVYIAEDDEWILAVPGQELFEDDKVKTGSDAYCDLIMPDKGLLRLESESEITIDELSEEVEKINVTKGGFLANLVNKLKGKETFEIETSTAVVAIRGTEFGVDFDDEEDMSVTVKEGAIATRPNIDLSKLDENEEAKTTIQDSLDMEVKDLQTTKITKEQKEEVEEEILSGIDKFIAEAEERVDQFIQESSDHFDEWMSSEESQFDEWMSSAEDSVDKVTDDPDSVLNEILAEANLTDIVSEAYDNAKIEVDELDDIEAEAIQVQFADLTDELVFERMEARMSGTDIDVDEEVEEEIEEDVDTSSQDYRRDNRRDDRRKNRR